MSTPILASDSFSSSRQGQRTFFGHPLSLSTVFGIELWERFSFYSLTALLLMYLSVDISHGGLGYPKATALSIVGAFQALPYLTTALWGWVADRILGREKTLFICAFIVLWGHIFLGIIPGKTGLALGLVCVGFGSGGVKTATQATISALYSKGDARVESAFSLYYLGVNLGALIGPIAMGFFHQKYGFHIAFSIAAGGMLIGIVHYCLGRKYLPQVVRRPTDPLVGRSKVTSLLVIAVGLCVVAGLFLSGIIHVSQIASVETMVIIIISVGYFTFLISSTKVHKPQETRRVLSFIPIFIVSVVFWSLYQQQFNVLQDMFNERAIKHYMGLTIPNEWFQFINPAWIILLSPLLSWLWVKLGQKNPPHVFKIGTGVVLCGVVYICVAFLPHLIPLWYLIALMGVMTFAELILAPVGMGLAGELAPRAYPAQMVILYLLIVALGSALTGVLSRFYHPEHPYGYFASLGMIAVGVGIVFLACAPMLYRFVKNTPQLIVSEEK